MHSLPDKRTLATLANSVDRHVGNKIRQRRLERGVTQQELARALGISYQQVQKYENGNNRVSAGRMFILAQALGIGVNEFFEDFGSPVPPGRLSLTSDETIQLAKELGAIEDVRLRTTLRALVRTIVDTRGVTRD